MAANDVYNVSFLFSINGEKCATVFHAEEQTTPGSTDPELDCADAFLDEVWPAMQDVMSQDGTLQMIRCRRVSPTVGGGILLPVGQVGDVAADTLPPNSCAVVSFYTNRLDRSGRGRVHIPGIPDTFQGDGLLESAQVGLFEIFAAKFEADINGSGGGVYRPGIWSPTHSQFNPITYHVTRSWLHTLRSRRMVAP